MIKNFKLKILNSEKGITLVEIMVIIVIMAFFTIILVTDFPRMLRQLALSRAVYNLGQDLRKTQDLGLSGIKLLDENEDTISVKGYGIYFNKNEEPTKYLIYADVADESGGFNQKYDGDFNRTDFCNQVNQAGLIEGKLVEDCIIDIIDVSTENTALFIGPISGIGETYGQQDIYESISINSSPPRPTTAIKSDIDSFSEISLCLGNSDKSQRCIDANSSGLIDVQ